MTDTIRTQAELLTIFEDCQDKGISAQDMRDFIVSVTEVPRLVAIESGAGTLYHSDAFYHPAQSNVIQDDLGLVNPDSYESDWYGNTWPAGQSFLLTPGIYQFTGAMYATEGFGSLELSDFQHFDFGIDFLEDPAAFSPMDPWHGNGWYDWVRGMPFSNTLYTRGSIILPAGNVPRHAGPIVAQNVGDFTLSFYYDLKKVGVL